MGYHQAGFDVTGVDINPQPRYPFEFVHADALEYLAEHGHEFDAVHASPPCQDHSVSRHASGGEHGTGWMLKATLDLVRQIGKPWVVENVGGAEMESAGTLCGTVFNLGIHRHRRFETSWFWLGPGCDPGAIRYRGRDAEVFGHHGNTTRVREEWEVPWMDQYGTAQSVPPVFTRFLGEMLMGEL